MAVDLRAEEITEIIRQQLSGIGRGVDVAEVGTVPLSETASPASTAWTRSWPASSCDFCHDVSGLALNLEQDPSASCSSASHQLIGEGDECRRTGRIMSVPVGQALVGRVVDPLGSSHRRQGARSTPPSSTPSSASLPAWSTASPSRSRCRRDSRPSTR